MLFKYRMYKYDTLTFWAKENSVSQSTAFTLYWPKGMRWSAFSTRDVWSGWVEWFITEQLVSDVLFHWAQFFN